MLGALRQPADFCLLDVDEWDPCVRAVIPTGIISTTDVRTMYHECYAPDVSSCKRTLLNVTPNASTLDTMCLPAISCGHEYLYRPKSHKRSFVRHNDIVMQRTPR